MDAKIEQLQQDIRRLTKEKAEREAALPAHSVRPHQLMAIEELEDEIDRKSKELELLQKDVENISTLADDA
jgi:hypothetical protein